jgi:hypothetical protein
VLLDLLARIDDENRQHCHRQQNQETVDHRNPFLLHVKDTIGRISMRKKSILI